LKIKPSNEGMFDALTWACIYGGLLCIVAAFALFSTEKWLAWILGGTGSLATAVGVALIYIRSKSEP
jgi:hypothetical protein